ncbi:hypothetical protein [Streptomyces cyaneofuscatus]
MPLDEELIALRREIHSRPELAADERAIGHGVRAMTGLLTHRLTALARTGRPSPGRREGADRP